MGLRIALVGLRFGAEFVPIYLHHPGVDEVILCDVDQDVLREIGDRYNVAGHADSLESVLGSTDVDAVHLVTPIPLHAKQTLAVLEAGKHCACTVPMATSIPDLEAIVAKVKTTGLRFMMMETAVYTREFLQIQEMFRSGELGKVQFLRGAHYQDMESWPPYWAGLPPMHYATHAIAPLLMLTGLRATRVTCLGSGTMRAALQKQYANPYPVETAQFQLSDGHTGAEVTRTLFHTARAYTESFHVYGQRLSFEWQQVESEDPVVFRMGTPQAGRGTPVSVERIACPDRAHLLPESIRRFTRRGVYDESNPHLSFLQGGGHGGSHPHLVHEFVSSIAEKRDPWVNAARAADITAAGICAHESAMNRGAPVEIPRF
jgi:predicted dehydrogenase